MGQVPTKNNAAPKTYLLIGRGRLAQHLSHWFLSKQAVQKKEVQAKEVQSNEFNSFQLQRWDRSQDPQELKKLLQQDPSHTIVLLAISDDALVSFYENNLKNYTGRVLHFSGVLDHAPLICAHPLMSFSKDLYEVPFYESIPFALTGFEKLQEVFPFLKNEALQIQASQKALYHAMAVMSGNFMTLLLQKIFKVSEKELNLKPSFFAPFLQKTLLNTLQNPEGSLTGPLIRGDFKTIEKHLTALEALESHSEVSLVAQELLKIYNSYMNIELAKVRKSV
jgi:hypothetical protein